MEPSNTASGFAGLTLVTGGIELEVELLDGSGPDGRKTETVKVRQLPIRHMEKYLTCFDDEAKAIELFCDKPPGWADSLASASFNDLIEKGQELNFPLFEGWYRRRMARAEILSPGLTAKLQDLVGRLAQAAAPSQTSVSPSQPEPASP